MYGISVCVGSEFAYPLTHMALLYGSLKIFSQHEELGSAAKFQRAEHGENGTLCYVSLCLEFHSRLGVGRWREGLWSLGKSDILENITRLYAVDTCRRF